jgi:hypothetical protein
MDAAGNFVVAWTDVHLAPGSWSWGIYTQRFDATGARLGPHSVVASTTTSSQTMPALAMQDDGRYVVVWDEWRQSQVDLLGRRFAADGTAVGSEFKANVHPVSSQKKPSVALEPDGRFVAAHHAFTPARFTHGIGLQRFASDGSRDGGGFLGDDGRGGAWQPDVASEGPDKSVVVWIEHGRLFGRHVGSATFQVDTSEYDFPYGPAVAMNDSGRFIVAWGDWSWRDGHAGGIYAQRYDLDPLPGGADLDGKALDFQADGMSDVLWYNTATGQSELWRMTGAQPTAKVALPTVGDLDWSIAAGGDFNADGRADLVWYRRTTGQVYLWLMSGATIAATIPVATVPDLEWRIHAAGDTDGDGRADLVWRHRVTGQVYVWLMNGGGIVGSRAVSAVNADWVLLGGRDFDGDRRLDLLWKNRWTGQVYVWLLDGGTVKDARPVATVLDLQWRIVVAGDFDADGKTDLVWRNNATGALYLWTMNGTMLKAVAPIMTVADPNWQIVASGDFGGDRKADLLWHHRTTGETYVWYMNGATPWIVARIGGNADSQWQPLALH